MAACMRSTAGGWKAGIILLLSFIIPTSPLFAQIQEDRAPALAPQPHASGLSTPLGRPTGDRLFAGLLAAGVRQLELEHKNAPEIPLLRGVLTGELSLSRLLDSTMVADMCDSGRQAGYEETSKPLWFCLGAITYGVFLAYLLSSSPDTERLPSMSPNDLARYSMCYKDGVKSARVKWAWIGVGTVALLALTVVGVILLLHLNQVAE